MSAGQGALEQERIDLVPVNNKRCDRMNGKMAGMFGMGSPKKYIMANGTHCQYNTAWHIT